MNSGHFIRFVLLSTELKIAPQWTQQYLENKSIFNFNTFLPIYFLIKGFYLAMCFKQTLKNFGAEDLTKSDYQAI